MEVHLFKNRNFCPQRSPARTGRGLLRVSLSSSPSSAVVSPSGIYSASSLADASSSTQPPAELFPPTPAVHGQITAALRAPGLRSLPLWRSAHHRRARHAASSGRRRLEPRAVARLEAAPQSLDFRVSSADVIDIGGFEIALASALSTCFCTLPVEVFTLSKLSNMKVRGTM